MQSIREDSYVDGSAGSWDDDSRGCGAGMTARFEGRTTRAAVLREIDRPLEIEELEIAEPGPGEVLVRLGASGVCHSDLHVFKGEWAAVRRPIVLGHEGAGTVEAVGEGVTRVALGEHVALSWLPSCGSCRHCLAGDPQRCLYAPETVFQGLMFDGTSRLRRGDEQIRSMLTVGSLGEHTVVPEIGAVPIDPSIPLDRAALVGCAVATGFGAAVNTARVRPGASSAVIGCGGVGVSVLQGCAAVSANPIIAIDTNPAKLALATGFGATHTIDASQHDPVKAVLEITGGLGVDFAFEAIGLEATIEQSMAMLGNGGSAVMVGMPPDGVKVKIDPNVMTSAEHRLLGCNYGSCNPGIDFPRILGLYREGRLDLDSMISCRLSLEEVNDAFAAMIAGDVVRSVIVYEEAGV
jgi:S-(hydroxymethyl)glutathione dehydrogenase/alcohol dehydrogenase